MTTEYGPTAVSRVWVAVRIADRKTTCQLFHRIRTGAPTWRQLNRLPDEERGYW